MTAREWCTRIIRWAYYLLFILVPLILSPWNYELFEFNKMMVTYGLTVIILFTWIIKMILDREIRIVKTPLDIPIFLFLGSQFISTLFSIDHHISWFGYYSRFNGGMWSLVCYTILYYAFVTNFLDISPPPQNSNQVQGSKPESRILNIDIHKFFYLALGTAFLVSFYGIAESFGIDSHLWVQDVRNRVFSTLGQPNWLAAYLDALLPVAMFFSFRGLDHSVKSKRGLTSPEFLVWTPVAVIMFWALLQTRSRSGYLGFAVADVLLISFLGLNYLKTKIGQTFIRWTAFLHILFFCFIFVIGTKVGFIDSWFTYSGLGQKFSPVQYAAPAQTPPPAKQPTDTKLIEVGISESTDIRKYVWQAAIDAWMHDPKNFLVGTGTETFAFTFYRYRSKEHNMTSEWDFLYNKAHNEYLNYLATTGTLGLGSYIALLGIFVIWFVKVQISKSKNQINNQFQSSKSEIKSTNPDYRTSNLDSWSLKSALFAGWVSILVTNFGGFSVVIMQIFLFLFPAIILVLDTRQRIFDTRYLNIPLPDMQSFQIIGKLTTVVLGTILLVNLMIGWWADTVFAKGYRLNRAEAYAQAEPLLSLAAMLRPSEPLYRDELATALTGTAVAALEAKNSADGTNLAKRAIEASDKALSVSPNNVNFWKTRTKLFFALSAYDPELLQNAIVALEEGYRLSPNDPKIMYNLAILYGRAGLSDRAVEILKKAIAIKPDYRDLYNGLYVIYTDLEKPADAKAILETYLSKVDPGDTEFRKIVEGK